MATGYTHAVGSGEVTAFSDFIMSCARAFGACISMRDEPSNAAIPEMFTPSSYHKDSLQKAKENLMRLEKMKDEEKREEVEKIYKEDLHYYEESVKKNAQTIANYKKMLEKVEEWNPPTEEHVGLKEFMVSQLSDSIKFDRHTYEPPKKMSIEEWHNIGVQCERDSIAYHTKKWSEEVERCEQRSKWVNDLRKSIQSKEEKNA